MSTRSYPYLIASSLKLQSDRWNSVACSGALVEKDYYGKNETYDGQGNRLDYYKDDAMISDYKSTGLLNFTPGRNKQIEFVKTYQPLAITLTGSGNDVGFGGVLESCVTPMDSEDTCNYASSPREIRMLASAIKDQYNNVRSLVRSIHDVSPHTRVYYMGYPQFLATNEEKCGGHVELSITERKVFREAATYLNSVIRAAAQSEGAIYVDIEDTLEEDKEHTLCGKDEEYVTGFNLDCTDTAARWFRGKDECQESFHPTADGHRLFADRLTKLYPDIVYGNYCGNDGCKVTTDSEDVPVPNVFEEALRDDANANYTPVAGGVQLAAQKGNPEGYISAKASGLQLDATANIYLTSDPIELGVYTVNSNGDLEVDIPVPPDIPVGFHTLHIQTNSFSGEPIELWWIIRIFGEEGDVDEDGVSDDKDACIFMPTTNTDRDGDGVDDGCDSVINEVGGTKKGLPMPYGVPPVLQNFNTKTKSPILSRMSNLPQSIAGKPNEVGHKEPEFLPFRDSKGVSLLEKYASERRHYEKVWVVAISTLVLVLVMLYLIKHYYAHKK